MTTEVQMAPEQYVRGTVMIENHEYEAIRFNTGIVHVFKTRRPERVSKAVANTFIKHTMIKEN